MKDLEMQLVRARHFVRTVPAGDLANMSKTRETLLMAARAAETAGNADLVLDCRRVTTRISVMEMASLVYMMMEHRDLFGRKVVILASDGECTDHLKFMEDFAVNRGLQLATFEDYEAAMNWLMPATPLDILSDN